MGARPTHTPKSKLSASIEKIDKERLQEIADAEERTVNYLVGRAIKEYIARYDNAHK